MTIVKRSLLLRIEVICEILVSFVASALGAPLPTNFRVAPLPGHPEFVFTMYGAPGELEPLKQLVQVMREQRLGNGSVFVLVGDIEFDEALITKLEFALKQGRKVLLGPAHLLALGHRFARLAKYTGAETLQAWINPATGRSGAISDLRLRELADQVSPVLVTGDPVLYSINRTRKARVV
jgi:hypothetical protein